MNIKNSSQSPRSLQASEYSSALMAATSVERMASARANRLGSTRGYEAWKLAVNIKYSSNIHCPSNGRK